MASGRIHDRFNLLALPLLCVFLYLLDTRMIFLGVSVIGYLFSTFIFSPDSDLRPKKRAGLFGIFLYAYSLYFRHRGRSHSILFGTITRFIYLLVVVAVCVFVFTDSENYMHYFQEFRDYMIGFNTRDFKYQAPLYFMFGSFCSDLVHVTTDVLSDFLKKLKKFPFG